MTKTHARIIQILAVSDESETIHETNVVTLLGSPRYVLAALNDLVREGIVERDRHGNIELASDCIVK